MTDSPVLRAIRAGLLGLIARHPRSSLAVAAGLGAASMLLLVSVL